MTTDYRAIADEIAADIAEGRLRPGERLSPQRTFAWRRGIAVSTVGRAYAELVRRGLVAGEVGRGTYVLTASPPPSPALTEPSRQPVDLQLNFPLPDGAGDLLAPALRSLAGSTDLMEALRPLSADATPAVRRAVAGMLGRPDWHPDAGALLFTGTGRQAIAAALSALARPGDRIGVEALTYAAMRGVASRLGFTLMPVPMDREGLTPEGLLEVHERTPLRAVYLQPSLHNPTGATMSRDRRVAVAALLQTTGLPAVEDAVYGFLVDEAPLAAYAPERVILVDSLSKRVAPGLTAGFLVVPPGLLEPAGAAVRAGGWGASGFALAAAQGWITDGAVEALVRIKRDDARARQALALDLLAGLQTRSDPRAYHLWLELPAAWRAETFVAAAARQGIAVTPAAAFAVVPAHAPNAVRLALASTPIDSLTAALAALRRLALSDPADFGFD